MLFLRSEQEATMQEHVEACLPEEGCGLVGGVESRATLILPVTNALHSPVRFEMDGRELVNAFLAFEEASLDLVAIFHSHPNGPPEPSETDLRSFMYPGVISIILVKKREHWQTRAFEITGDGWNEVPIIRE